LTTGKAINVAHTTSVISSTGTLLNLSSSAVDTGSQYLANFTSTGSTGGTAVLMTATNSGQLTNTILNVVASGYTTGYTGNVVSITGCSTTGAANTLLVTGVNTAAGSTLAVVNNAALATAGYGLSVFHTTGVIASGGSLVEISSTSNDTGTSNGVLLDMSSTASTAGTQVLMTFSGITTGIAQSMVLAAQ